MIYTDRKETMLRLEQWKQHHSNLTAITKNLKLLLGCLANNPLSDVIWLTFESYTRTLVELLGATSWPDDWLTWYAYENDMGKKGLKAGYNGKLKPIKNLGDLCRLIEKARKQP